jgi:hypothetical protein
MQETVYIGVRVPRETYDALVARQKKESIDVSLSAVIRRILQVGLEKTKGRTNGKKR